jgi:hypothetical protein
MAAFGMSSSEIGRLLHRSPSAVRKRASFSEKRFRADESDWHGPFGRPIKDRLRMLLGAGKPIEFVAAKLKTFREGCYGSCLRTSNIAQTQTEAESEGE